LLLRGQAGVGKSSLIEKVRRDAHACGLDVLALGGVRGEREMPLAALSVLLRPLVDEVGELPPRQREAMLGALVLGDSIPDPAGVSAALVSLLSRASRRRGLLVLVDDVDQIDRPSRDALLFAARRLTPGHAGFVLSSRDLLTSSAGILGVVDVDPLADEFADALLHHSSPTQLSASVTRELLLAAEGNPLALRELPLALTPDQRSGADFLPDPLPVTAPLIAAFGAPERSLSPEAHRGLAVLAAHSSARSSSCPARCATSRRRSAARS
jgi:hypothetical protein